MKTAADSQHSQVASGHQLLRDGYRKNGLSSEVEVGSAKYHHDVVTGAGRHHLGWAIVTDIRMRKLVYVPNRGLLTYSPTEKSPHLVFETNPPRQTRKSP